MNAQQPIKIYNLSVTLSGTIFFNKGATIQDLPSHSITFQFVPQEPFHVNTVNSLVKSTSGIFNVCGKIKWKGKAHVPSEKNTTTTKSVCDATLTDSTNLFHYQYGKTTSLQLKKGNFIHLQMQAAALLWKMFDHNQSNYIVFCGKKQRC